MSYPIVRKPSNRFFPHGGDRRSETHWNDASNELNWRRLRIDPLKDGYDPPDEDPTQEDGPESNTPRLPI